MLEVRVSPVKQQPSIAAIYIGAEDEGPMARVPAVEAVAGRGLTGDRYFQPEQGGDPTEEVTLVALEGIEEAAATSGLDITPEDTRRNLVTHGVDLDELIGTRFLVGEVELEGLEPNPPCKHLVKVTGKDLLKPLIDKGGIRARIHRGGTVHEGDALRRA